MNKTGSSSIQKTFARQTFDGLRYIDWRSENHTGLFGLLFHDPVESRNSFRKRGETREELMAERAEWRARLAAQLEGGGDDAFLLSAEGISGATDDAVEKLADFVGGFTTDIRVIAYVRAPISFMQSAFQQRVRGGMEPRLAPKGLWPDYRRRFEKLDRVFGRERVMLKMFAPAALRGGDVVQDFAHEIGVRLDPQTVVRENVGISLEAVALMFALRRFAPADEGGAKAGLRAARPLFAALETIGGSKLAFAASLTDPVVRRYRDDLDWMEARLGRPLMDAPSGAGRPIATEDDLLAVARESCVALERLLEASIRTDQPAPHGRLARDLELLRTVCA